MVDRLEDKLTSVRGGPKRRVLMLLTGGLLVLIAQLTPAVASAQSPDDEAEKLISSAVDAYGQLQFDRAEKKLDRAIELARRKEVSDDVLARAHVMRGVLVFGRSRDKQAARKAFVRALKLDPKASIEPVVRTPTLKKIMKSARKSVDTEPEKVEPEVQHEPIVSAQAGEALTVRASVPEGAPVEGLALAYRLYGRESFDWIEFERTSATDFEAVIPADRVRTSQIAYYIVAKSSDGEVADRAGSRSDPFQITVLGTADMEEKPSAEKKTESTEETGPPGTTERSRETARDQTVTAEKDEPARRSEPAIEGGFVQLSGGTGVGFLSGGKPTANPEWPWNPGLASAIGHLLLDTGLRISERSSLGLYFQWQFSPAQNFDKIRREQPSRDLSGFTDDECLAMGLPGDCLLGLKYRYFLDRSGSFHLFSSVGGGVGRARHLLRLKENDVESFCKPKGREIHGTGDRQYCFRLDTIRPGPVHFGVGGGFSWELTELLSIVAEGYLEVFIPENTAVNLDVNVGPMLTF